MADAQPGTDAVCEPATRRRPAAGDTLAPHLAAATDGDGVPRRRVPRRQPLVADLVANDIRGRILHGDLEDGSVLPMQDEIIRQYAVSRAAVREALHVLEAEGLVTVRRGALGGAVVHAPTPQGTAYTLAMLLESQGATLRDVGQALANVEPMCAVHAATRPDRMETVLPELERAHAAMAASLHDGPGAVATSRRWHECLVAGCGNTTMINVAGLLEVLWTGHEATWALEADEEGRFPELPLREKALREHREIMDAIARGDTEAVSTLSRAHLLAAQQFPLTPEWDLPIDAMAVRRQWQPSPRPPGPAGPAGPASPARP